MLAWSDISQLINYPMEENSIRELRKAIDRLVKTRDRIANGLVRDKGQLSTLQSKIEKTTERVESLATRTETLEGTIEDYEQTIADRELEYKKIMDITHGLIATLDQEQKNYRSRFTQGKD